MDCCARRHIEFTRSRAYRKNDRAWIEQKNGAAMHRFVGYERYRGPIAGQALAHLYGAVRLYVNFFQPSFKLMSKMREGAKVSKRYLPPVTPCERLLAHEAVDSETKNALRAQPQRRRLDPVTLLHTIREAQSALTAIARVPRPTGPCIACRSNSFSQLPELWRLGEVRPTYSPRARSRRYWRTRKDTFEGVWPQVLLWLQQEPDTMAKALFGRPRTLHPHRFGDVQLRTLQRRVRQWRNVMARQLVFGGLGKSDPSVTAPIGAERRSANHPGNAADMDVGLLSPSGTTMSADALIASRNSPEPNSPTPCPQLCEPQTLAETGARGGQVRRRFDGTHRTAFRRPYKRENFDTSFRSCPPRCGSVSRLVTSNRPHVPRG